MIEAALEQRVAAATGLPPDHVGWHMHLPEFWQRYLIAMLDAGVRMTWPDQRSTPLGFWWHRMQQHLRRRSSVISHQSR